MKRLITFLMLLSALTGGMRARIVQQWVFNDDDWATTKAQTTSSSYWTISKNNNNVETDARNTVSTIPADNGIDKIQGLAFSGLGNRSLCLDWTYRHVWMNGSVTVPNLEAGQVVTFVVSGNITVSAGDSPITNNNGTFTYTVPTGVAGGVTFCSKWLSLFYHRHQFRVRLDIHDDYDRIRWR